MKCGEARWKLEEAGSGEMAEPVRGHLEACAECRAYAEDWGLLREGFEGLAEETVAEASVGFKERLRRRLEDELQAGGQIPDFLEQVGRRVVFATLVLTVLLLAALSFPSSGPLRGPEDAEAVLAQPETASVNYGLIFADDTWENRNLNPAKPTRRLEPKQK